MSDTDFLSSDRDCGFVGMTFVKAGRESGFRFGGGGGGTAGGSGGGELGGWEDGISIVSSGGLGCGMVGATLVKAGWVVGLGLGGGSDAVGGFGATIFEKVTRELGFAFDIWGRTSRVGDSKVGGLV